MAQNDLDPRRHAFRSDLANTTLRNQVQATNYVDGQTAQLASTAPVRKSPSHDAKLDTQALRGESVQVFEISNGWAWVQLQNDSYVGYVPADSLAPGIMFATHVITSPRALLFPKPDLKTPPIGCFFMGSEITVEAQKGDYIRIASGGYIHNRVAAPTLTYASDYVAIAERFLGTTYLWGGKTADGLDCSGLVQIAMHACGKACPRDSDMQMAEVGVSIGTEARADLMRRGDLIFWPGHVGIMMDEHRLLHANAWHMETAIEPVNEAVTRIANDGNPILDIRRPDDEMS